MWCLDRERLGFGGRTQCPNDIGYDLAGRAGRVARKLGVRFASAVVLVTAVSLLACGGGDKGGAPTLPPVPTPTPAAGATPEPPVSAACERLPLGSATHVCRNESASFFDEVGDAIDQLRRERPEYFKGDIVTNMGGYYVGVIRLLDRKGICAAFDGEELAVKNANEYSDQYKILTSWGQVRRAYMTTCYPAVFPLSRSTPAASPPGCTLPPSTEIACGRPDPQYLAEMEKAIDQVLAQKPGLFDATQKAPGTDWPAVTDMLAYHGALVEVLSKAGYCGRFDGEEIQVKRSNEFSEHYDVNYADKYVRRGPGIFRSSCYPAAF